MSEARYTKEQISNLAADVLEFYSNKQVSCKSAQYCSQSRFASI